MVSADDINKPVAQCLSQCIAICCGLHGRIALDTSAVCCIVGIRIVKVRKADLCGDLFVGELPLLQESQFACRTDM